MIPAVTVPANPSGEPIASTWSPTLNPDDVPSCAGANPCGSATCRTARSSSWSVPTMRASALSVTQNDRDRAALADRLDDVRIGEDAALTVEDEAASALAVGRLHRDDARQRALGDIAERLSGVGGNDGPET